ncbi:fam-c protein [Plasmodium vinckei brucechwatti]|uniref:Fam-c protein n=1 Tax=Plasmodium vinckei brucechwatti TaxID=119398 RepID=A0A6V7RT47_PLAVN|nr:fam-c protein [Plasmodium vinckei brucechwatti]
MNKRVFSLVYIVFYALLAVSIHCLEQKASSVRSFFQVTKKANKSKEKNDIESECEAQLNNNNNNNPKNDEDKKKKNRRIVIYYDEKTNLWGYGCCGLWYLFD